MRLALISMLCLAACAMPTGTYVADIQPTAGGFTVTRCDFDSHGKATTNVCSTQTIYTEPPPAVGGALPPERPRKIRPAPTAEEVAAALNAPAVHDLVVQCRGVYARTLTSFAFRVTLEAHTGVGAIEPSPGTDAAFVDCAVRALRSATIPRFDGAPVSYDETLAL